MANFFSAVTPADIQFDLFICANLWIVVATIFVFPASASAKSLEVALSSITLITPG